ncbi:MAG: hypothetical protein ACRDVW_02505 [Acidimicrobiales bacterium]
MASVLLETDREPQADQLTRHSKVARRLLERPDANNHGIQPTALAGAPGFVDVVEQLHSVLGPQYGAETGDRVLAQLADVLGPARTRLRSATFIRKRSLNRPGRPRWYQRLAIAVRLPAVLDRLRSFRGSYTSLAYSKPADRHNQEG